MKHSVGFVVARFPNVRRRLDGQELSQPLNDVEQVMYQLCLYFDHPRAHTFALQQIYDLRDGKWIAFVLEAIRLFFERDTYVMAGETLPSFVQDSERGAYFNQSDFARYLQDQGIPYTQNKIAVYRKRGKFPSEDFIFDGKPFWLRETVLRFVEEHHTP
ncbi:hypothetical protein [Thalassobacillus pellis]|uniref:hypothetical protein n=1 Tax=Thalassobacillus pellis TaxID=748008 RepID=UPI001961F873|nr:hypothetical protein [Thalassobacillus pellis]MBM7554516.1 hypothetical protein [Thalassobacillus pellis]